MLRSQDIICISSIDWDFIWQGHQEIMSTLAAHGNRVLFIENTGVRAPTLQDLPRLKRRLVNWWRSTWGFRRERENLYLYSPIVLPFPYSWFARLINRFVILRAIRRWMRVMDFSSPIVWTFLPTALARDLIHGLNPRLVIYYCIDNFAQSSRFARKISITEQQVIAEADLVFVTSHKLHQHASAYNSEVFFFPFGVSLEKFEQAREDGYRVCPKDIADVAKPVIGYVGGIHKWIDLELIKELARCYPRFHFALVGPIQSDISPLQGLPNVHFLGEKAHGVVPDYVQAFDVALIPYRLTEYTENVYPTKLNEYLAMGKPVVSTPLREVKLFNERYGGIVAVGADSAEFGKRIEEALCENGAFQARRIAVARENSWSSRIEQMSELIEKKLRHRSEARELRWQEIFLELYGRARRKVALTTAVLVFLYFLLFFSPFPWWVAAPLKFADPPRRADAIVVLAGGVGESGKAGQGYEERVKQAVKLFQAGYASRLIFSSGYVFAFEEAEVMKALTVSLGIPAEAILLEKQAGNTYENVKYVSEILNQHGWRTVLLVSSPYHMRRVSLVFAKQAPDVRVYYTPIENSHFYSHGRGASLTQLQAILHEYAAIVVYWWRRWV